MCRSGSRSSRRARALLRPCCAARAACSRDLSRTRVTNGTAWSRAPPRRSRGVACSMCPGAARTSICVRVRRTGTWHGRARCSSTGAEIRTDERMRPPDIAYLTDIYFGFGSVAVVPQLLARFGVLRPLVVTDAGLMELGMAARLGIGNPETFSDTETNPTEANLRACLARYFEKGCDGIVALGGGASLDLAKLVGLMAGHPPPLEQYAILRGGMARIGASIPPIVAVPSTPRNR